MFIDHTPSIKDNTSDMHLETSVRPIQINVSQNFDKTETSLAREERGTIEGFFLIVCHVRITGILIEIWR
jgi:hypothetical protein